MIRDIAISDRDWKRRLRRSCGFLSRGSGGRDNSELLRLDDAGIERRGPGIEPFLGALASVAGVQFRALQSRQGPIEAPDAILVGELRGIEAQDDGTGVADLRRKRAERLPQRRRSKPTLRPADRVERTDHLPGRREGICDDHLSCPWPMGASGRCVRSIGSSGGETAGYSPSAFSFAFDAFDAQRRAHAGAVSAPPASRSRAHLIVGHRGIGNAPSYP